jgi:transcription elongation factor Elf1
MQKNSKKIYHCQIDGCGKGVLLRSTIKEGEFAGLKVCAYCKSKFEGKKKVKKVVKSKTDYRPFFDTMIEELRGKPFCENCGCRIKVDYLPHFNVAHILSKQKYKSVALEPNNIIFLCSSKDKENVGCHEIYDSGLEQRSLMPVFSTAKERLEKIADKITEKGKERNVFEL